MCTGLGEQFSEINVLSPVHPNEQLLGDGWQARPDCDLITLAAVT